MAEFVTVMKERERMCEENCKKGRKCAICKLSSRNNGKGMACANFTIEHPEESEKIIMDWAAAHPVETMKDRFFKMFPNAPKTYSGVPRCCVKCVGWVEMCPNSSCSECWNRPYEERSVKNE